MFSKIQSVSLLSIKLSVNTALIQGIASNQSKLQIILNMKMSEPVYLKSAQVKNKPRLFWLN